MEKKSSEGVKMFRLYKEKRFIEGSTNALYENEASELAICLCEAVCDKRSLTDIYENPGCLDSKSTLKDILCHTARIFASSNVERLKKMPNYSINKKFLNRFTKHFFPDSNMNFTEKYESWIIFCFQRFLYWKMLDINDTPDNIEKDGKIDRFFVVDPSFTVKAASVYGTLLAKGMTRKRNDAELCKDIKTAEEMYRQLAFTRAINFEEWTNTYFMSKGAGSTYIDEVAELILTVFEKYKSICSNFEFNDVMSATKFVWEKSNPDGSDRDYWLDIYLQTLDVA